MTRLPLDHKPARTMPPHVVGPALIGDARPLAVAWREWMASLDPAVQIAIDEQLQGIAPRKSVRTAWYRWLWLWGLKAPEAMDRVRAMDTPPPGWRPFRRHRGVTDCRLWGVPGWALATRSGTRHFIAGRHLSGHDLAALRVRCGGCAARERVSRRGWYCAFAEIYTYRQSPACSLWTPRTKRPA